MSQSYTDSLAPDNGAFATGTVMHVPKGQSVSYSATFVAGATHKVVLEKSSNNIGWSPIVQVDVFDGSGDNFSGVYKNDTPGDLLIRFRSKETSGASTDEVVTAVLSLIDGTDSVSVGSSAQDFKLSTLSGAPTDGTTGKNSSPVGSLMIDKTNGRVYQNIGTQSSPIWQEVGGQTAVRFIRRRFTLAEVNAGATLLAAVVGYKYKAVDCKVIAVGGAAAAGTSVDVKGTQSTSAVKLFSVAQAQLTRSAVNGPGITGTTVLADGASFVACDANTAITVIKAGSDFTTATHFDVLFSYVVEQ